MTSQQYALTTRSQRPVNGMNLTRGPRLVVPPFLQKVYEMLNDPANANLIRWSEAGDSFYVLDHERFARELLGRWFKHQNFNTFVRQLNMYGFHKIPHLHQGALRSEPDTDYWHYEHPHFIRGQPQLLGLIQRKKQVNSSAEESAIDFRNLTATSVPNSNNLSPGQILDIHTIINGVAAIKRHQQTITNELDELKKSNQLLWQDAVTARARYQKHQDIINKILRFLASVFGHNGETTVRDDDEARRETSSPLQRRPTRLMIANGTPKCAKSSSATASSSTAKVQVPEVEDVETPSIVPQKISPDDYMAETPLGTDPPTPVPEYVPTPRAASETLPPFPNSPSTSRSSDNLPSPLPYMGNSVHPTLSPDSSDTMLQSALSQLLGQPGQMQRLLAALATQPMSIPESSPPPSQASQLTQYDPNFDLSHIFSADAQPNSPVPYIPSPSLSHQALTFNAQLDNTQKVHEDTNKTMDTVESSLHSLIQSLGVGELDPSHLPDMASEDSGNNTGMPASPSEPMATHFEEASRIDAPQPDFDFEALLNDLATSENPLGDVDFVDMPSTGFLDEVPSPSATSPSMFRVSLPDTIEHIHDKGRKRKSDVIDLDGIRTGITAAANGKTKTRRTG